MANVTMKSTKQEIMDAYNEMKEKLQAKSALVEDPMKAIRDAETKKIHEDAQGIVDTGILNSEYTEKWTNLNKAIADKEAELKELYGITRDAEAMSAMINAHKLKKHELEEAYKEKTEQLQIEYNEKESTLRKNHAIVLETIKEEKEAAQKEYQRKKEEFAESLAEQKAAASQTRQREQEEYVYSLKRQRKLENDKWADEVAKREQLMSDKETTTQKLLAEAESKIEYIAALESKVAAFPSELAQAVAEAEEKGKKAAGKEYGYEKAMYMKEKEYELKSVKDALDRAEEANERLERKVAELTTKLDESYTRMQELASTTVKSNGGVKILDRESTNNK